MHSGPAPFLLPCPTWKRLKLLSCPCNHTEKGSRETSNGARVKLDVSDRQALPAFSLFPGQIVALEATNTDGESLHVTNIYSVRKRRARLSLTYFFEFESVQETQRVNLICYSFSGRATSEKEDDTGGAHAVLLPRHGPGALRG